MSDVVQGMELIGPECHCRKRPDVHRHIAPDEPAPEKACSCNPLSHSRDKGCPCRCHQPVAPDETSENALREATAEYLFDYDLADELLALPAFQTALAEERRKAREPFLALADELDRLEIDPWSTLRLPEIERIADRIRRAAEESGE